MENNKNQVAAARAAGALEWGLATEPVPKRIVVVDEFPWHAVDKYANLDITPVYPLDVVEWIRLMKRDGYEVVSYVRDEEVAKAISCAVDRSIEKYDAWSQGDEFLLIEKDFQFSI